ncbi:MAG: hypothetical protein ACYCT9_05415 [Leptospirillum sp.]
MTRDMVCLKCPLPDCLPQDPGCLLKKKTKKGKMGEGDIPLPVGLRVVARKLGVSYETVRSRIKKRQWDSLPKLFRSGPRGDWKSYLPDLEEFQKKMRGGAA